MQNQCKVVIKSSRQDNLELNFVPLDTRQLGVPVILREVMLPNEFVPVSPSITVKNVTADLPYKMNIDMFFF
ncbi:unnamed protein product [Schistosoma curassoni]|uniref:Uncharacterized protein n=1 Tax=Schistosoma curassoni TaxID=6186 RepID=A0A183KK95_9TREM|nr:unnamed protein product [Schistosoma curassoni]